MLELVFFQPLLGGGVGSQVPVGVGGDLGDAGPDGAAWIDEAVERLYPSVVEIRRHVHAHPELGERELETAALAAAHLRELGLEVREGIGGTGVVGVLRGGRPGPVVAYRADMDALPITERTGLPYASTRTDTWDDSEVGVMHACGHDLHVAIALGVASILSERRAELAGTVLFVFQPAEEGMPTPGPHGAERMLEEGAFEDPRPAAVFGLHVNPNLALGQVSVVPGGAMAAVDRFRVTVHGRQAHGAYPHAGIDPIVAASHVVVALQTIASRNVNTHDTVVVTVGVFDAGNRFNIIPEEARLVGTIRTHDASVRERVHERLREIVAGTAQAHGARAEVEIEGITPVTVNDPDLCARMRRVVAASVGEANLVDEVPHMGGEDFAFFANEVPGVYYFLGVGDDANGAQALLHTPAFVPAEGALAVGMRTSARLLVAYLEAERAR